ncbi:hypothetical protein TrLO_g2751 [Triparma laevis f. longispina]|uniref:Uncharacterized protein n=1 Tax=Triparma laevis f. longispina TaxID=1714387 RepID=A0A9W7FU14_9STRA|nr:hypothetical protein TrLO_g2751 [Triparma laevis f. longispina]
MSQQSVAMRSSSRLKAQELGGESGGEDEESQNQGQGQGPVETPAARITKDDFMATDDFRRLLRGYVDVTELYRTFRMVSKSWQRVAEEEIDWGFRSGVLAFHGGYDLVGIDGTGELEEKHSLQTLGDYVFADCYKLVPSSINVDYGCCMSAKGPDSTSKGRRLPPKAAERTAELEKMLAERDEENDALNAKNVKQASEIAVLTTENAEQATEIAALTTKNTALTTETAAQATVIATLTNENAALKIAALTTDVLALKIANAPAPHTNDFISTIDFKRHFVGFVHIEMLLVLREVCKEWNDVVVERVDESVESGVMIVHEGKDIDEDDAFARKDRCELVMQVIFLPNITKVGENVCDLAANLVVVHIPEGARLLPGMRQASPLQY